MSSGRANTLIAESRDQMSNLRPIMAAVALLALTATATAADPLPPGVVTRVGSTRLRPGDSGPMVFSPDGKTLATFGPQSGVCLWDAATGDLQRRIEIHESGK